MNNTLKQTIMRMKANRPILLSLAQAILAVNAIVKLEHIQAAQYHILMRLLAAYPGVMTGHQLAELDGVSDNISLTVSRLNGRLVRHDCRVVTAKGKGYWLEFHKENDNVPQT